MHTLILSIYLNNQRIIDLIRKLKFAADCKLRFKLRRRTDNEISMLLHTLVSSGNFYLDENYKNLRRKFATPAIDRYTK